MAEAMSERWVVRRLTPSTKQIGDPHGAGLILDSPIQPDYVAVRPVDLRVDQEAAVFIASRVGHLELLTGVLGEGLGIGLHQQTLEQLLEVGLLGICRDLPITAEDELVDSRHVEMRLKEATEALFPLGLADTGASQRADRIRAQAADEFHGVIAGRSGFGR